MDDGATREFAERVQQVLERFFSQQEDGRAVPVDAIAIIARRLAAIAARRGATERNGTERGEPPEMSAAEVAEMMAEVLAGVPGAERLAGAVKQLVKGCFQATRQVCRESYREVDAAGVCRRQVRAKAGERVSGTHCVDCPYWTALKAEAHAQLLAGAWVGAGGAAEFAAARAVFLPEDFRALRRTARAMAGELRIRPGD